MTAPAPDPDIGSWIRRHIDDLRIQTVLLVVVAAALVSSLIFGSFGSPAAALEALGLFVLFTYAGLLLITASAAFYPLGQKATLNDAKAAGRAQTNARVSFSILVIVGVLATLGIVNFVAPLWPALTFEFAYQQLRWKRIDLREFFDTTARSDDRSDEILDVRNIEDVFSDGRFVDVRQALALVGRRPEMSVSVEDLRRLRHSGLIAARKVIFDRNSAVELGDKSLLIVAEEIEIRSRPASGAAVFAYPAEEYSRPATEEGSSGAPGANAGNVTIVILGRLSGSDRLLLDLRGQPGRQGQRGVQGPARDPMPDRGRQISAPSWAFGEPENKLFEIWSKNVQNQLSHKTDLDEEMVFRLEQTRDAIVQCMKRMGRCNTLYCRDIDYEKKGVGHPGGKGHRGEAGKPGGAPGAAGRLELYTVSTEVSERPAPRFQWLGGNAIDEQPPAAPPGPGGPGGPGGNGGQGGRGYEADPLGLCSAGAPGEQGQRGDQGPAGDPGPERPAGPEGKIGLIGEL